MYNSELRLPHFYSLYILKHCFLPPLKFCVNSSLHCPIMLCILIGKLCQLGISRLDVMVCPMGFHTWGLLGPAVDGTSPPVPGELRSCLSWALLSAQSSAPMAVEESRPQSEKWLPVNLEVWVSLQALLPLKEMWVLCCAEIAKKTPCSQGRIQIYYRH